MNSFYEHAADSKEVLNIFEHNTTSIGTISIQVSNLFIPLAGKPTFSTTDITIQSGKMKFMLYRA